IAKDPRDVDTMKSAQRLLASGVLTHLSVRDQTLLLELLRVLPSADRVQLATLAERKLHNGSAIADRDFEDTMLIAHLHALALELLAPLAHPRSGPSKDSFVMPGGHGIDADVTARALAFLYGVGFTVAAGASAAMRTIERVGPDMQRVPPVFFSLLYDGGER